MLALRQEARALARLAQLSQCSATVPSSSPAAAAASGAARGGLASSSGTSAAPGWLHATTRQVWGRSKGGVEDDGSKGGGGGITGWLTSKLPGMLGGDKVEDLDIETFGTSLKRARQLGGLSGFVHGTSAINDGQAQGTLRMFEQIIDAMRPEEKKDLKLFDSAARQRVAAEVDRMLGSWRQYKTEADSSAEGGVPLDHLGPKGQRCGLAGQPVSRNTKCPLTRKAFKACCGKTLQIEGS
ncbi:hypothetical protein ABPG75_009361 [Micractinium tetrahymenae]